MPHSRRLTLALLTLFLLLAGCSSGGGGGGVVQGGAGGAGGGTTPPPVDASVATVVVQQSAVLSQSSGSELRFTGFDAVGETLYGPVTRPDAAETVLEEVPIEVSTFLLEKLTDGQVVSSGVFRVELREDETVIIREQDVAPLEDVLVSLVVAPEGANLSFPETLQLRATGTTSDGAELDVSGGVAWTVNDPALATVSSSGLLRPLGVGSVTVTATSGEISDATTVQVLPASSDVLSLEVLPALARSAPGATRDYRVMGTFPGGEVRDVTDQVAWTSSKPGIVVSGGRAAILPTVETSPAASLTAHLGEVSGSATLRLGANLFSTGAWDDSLRSFAIGGDGELTLLQTLSVPAAPEGLAVGLDGLHLYVGRANAGQIGVFTIGEDGTLSVLQPSTEVGGGTTDLAIHPNGRVLYANGVSSNLVYLYDIAPNGTVEYREQVDTRGHEPRDLALTPDGKFLYVTHSYSAEVTAFAVAPETGSLTYVETEALGIRPWSASADPSSTHLYVALVGTNEIGSTTLAPTERLP